MKIDPHLKLELKKFFQERIVENKRRITILSGYKLSNQEKSELALRIPIIKNATNIVYVTDRDIIAGIIVKVGSSVLDLSLKGQVNSLKNFVYEHS